jgi:hypothetical protein
MEKDEIKEIGINESEQLYIMPLNQKFPYMYREAIQVHWDNNGSFLYSPKPEKWSYLDWFKHIIGGARIQSCRLCITENTKWRNIPKKLKTDIIGWYENAL